MYQTDFLFGFAMPDHLSLQRQWLAREWPNIREGALYIDADGTAIQVFYGVPPLIVPTSLSTAHMSINEEDYEQLERLAQYVRAIYADAITDAASHNLNMFTFSAVISADYYVREECTAEQILSAELEHMVL